jgi:outer membrane protein insertion porin family
VDVGSLWKLDKPNLNDSRGICAPPTPAAGETAQDPYKLQAGDTACPTNFTFVPGSGYKEVFLDSSAKPRLSVGIGVNWTSPFGPLRIDIAKALLKQDGDDTKLFSFNVGTQF